MNNMKINSDKKGGDSMRIFVENVFGSGNVIELDVTESDTIGEILSTVFSVEGIPENFKDSSDDTMGYQLQYRGAPLENDMTVEQCGINENDRLVLMQVIVAAR